MARDTNSVFSSKDPKEGLKELFKGQIFDDIHMDQKLSPLSLVAAVFFVIAAVFLLRLVFLQVIVSDHYTAMAQETRTINFNTTPRRGTIYDRNGVVLAVSVDATSIYCNPHEVKDPRTEAYMIAKVLGGEIEDYLPSLENKETQLYDPDSGELVLDEETGEPVMVNVTFSYIKRQADTELAQKVKELDLPGVYFTPDTRREYPNGAIGGQVIGVCDIDGNGITGLELQYDEILRGTPGKYSAERGEKGTPIPGGVIIDEPAIDGEDIMISLDIKLQDTVERALAEGIAPYEAKKGSSVVMDSATGEIYAICSFPYLDPNDLENSLIGSENLTAITQPYEPGSIFKSISALAVLEQRAVEPTDAIWCPAKLPADEYEIKDAHARGDVYMTFETILNQSSNVGISLATEKAGFQYLNEIISRLKILEKTGVDYPGEVAGIMEDFSSWAKVTGYNISFGQGITASPLQMVRAYGAICNDGVLTTPHFLLSKPQTGTWEEYESEKVIDDMEALAKLKSMMRGVVSSGTGKNANIDGYKVVGKTSTAEIAENGTYAENRYNLCFTGFIDESNSDLVCFVSANDVVYEGNVSGIFSDIMSEAIEQYNIVPKASQ